MKCFKLPPIFPKGRPYYVFFAYGGKYSGRYAEIRAGSLEKAICTAMELYGHEVACVENNIENAVAKIHAYKLVELSAADYAGAPI